MQDPESKTGFYNAIAKKLLEFPEKLERDNYTEAVAREYMIPETDLKNLVNSMGGLIGVTTREREYDKERTRQKKEKAEVPETASHLAYRASAAFRKDPRHYHTGGF